MEQTKPHILMIAYFFPPGQGIGGFRPYRFYKYLKRMGFVVHVVTAQARELNWCKDVNSIPDHVGKIWEGSSKERLSFKGYLELILRKIFFPGHLGLVWSLDVKARCRQILRDHPQSQFVLFSTFPPLGVVLAGFWVQRHAKIPWIADFRDPLGVGLKVGDTSRWIRLCNYIIERLVFHGTDAVIANTQAAAQMFAARYPWASPKLHVIWNGFDPENQFRARAIPARAQKVIIHAGSLYSGRDPSLIIESLMRLRTNGLAQAEQACILLVGAIEFHKTGMNPELYERAEQESLLQCLPQVPKAEAQRMTEEADGLLLVQPQTDVQVPTKLFEYICIGRPILALVPRKSAVEHILENAGVPYVCIYADDQLEDVDRKMLDFLRIPSQPTPYSEWFGHNFNGESQVKQMADIIDEIS